MKGASGTCPAKGRNNLLITGDCLVTVQCSSISDLTDYCGAELHGAEFNLSIDVCWRLVDGRAVVG